MSSDDEQPNSSDQKHWPRSFAAWQKEVRDRQAARKTLLETPPLHGECSDSSEDATRRGRFLDHARQQRARSSDDAASEGRVGIVAAIEVRLDWDRFEGSFATTFEPTRHTTMVLGRPVQVEGVANSGKDCSKLSTGFAYFSIAFLHLKTAS